MFTIAPPPTIPQAGVNLTPAAQMTQTLGAIPGLLAGIQNLFGKEQQQNQQPQGTLGSMINGPQGAATPTTPATPGASPANPATPAAPATAGQMTTQPQPFQGNTGYNPSGANRNVFPMLPITGLGQAGLSDPTGLLGQMLRARMNQNPFMQPPGSGFASGLPSLNPTG